MAGVISGCILIGSMGIAQTADDAATRSRLEQVAESYTTGNAFMGAVLVAEGDRILLDRGYGMADLEWSIPNTPDVKFRLGSLTKQFTAALVLQLQDEKKLKIDDRVKKYLPDVPKSWDNITLADLLNHTSGIPNFTGFKEFASWCMSPHSPAEELAFFTDKPLEFEPGSRFEYSNSNYEVLGAVIEKISGKSYGDLLRERIFDPLDMKDSGLDTDELILPRRARGYTAGNGWLVPARSESMTVPWAAGGVYSTTGDLLKWERGLFGGKVLSAKALREMTTPRLGNYGLGLFIDENDGAKVIAHGGGIEGFNTYLAYLPERSVAVVVLSNVNGAAPKEMAQQLLAVMLGKQVTLANERKAQPIENAELARFVGTYDLTPAFALTIALTPDGLTAQGTGQPALPLLYEGAADGHPRFFSRTVNAEIELIPDASGAISSLILHQGGRDMPAKRH